GLGGETKIARACIAEDEKEAFSKAQEGDILIVPEFSSELTSILDKIRGLIIESKKLPPELIPWRSKGLGIIIGTGKIRDKLSHGEIITIDPERGVIYRGVIRTT
ncbi:MAG: pyruvate kinase, partial [Dictyoglomaceae bacterium]|nr:pyruvate kinase [Dictyoglomaceae bacterium]